jgi:excisionase family DNA binding protein
MGLLNLEEAAKYLGISTRALRDLANRGILTHIRLNYRSWRFKTEDLEQYLQRRTILAKGVHV